MDTAHFRAYKNRDYTQASALWMSRGFRSYHTLNGIINLTVEALSMTCPTFYNSHYKPPWLYPITFSSMGRWYRWNGQYKAASLNQKRWVLSAAMKRNPIELAMLLLHHVRSSGSLEGVGGGTSSAMLRPHFEVAYLGLELVYMASVFVIDFWLKR